jgi:DNA-binding NarL/FixJ family response regulator
MSQLPNPLTGNIDKGDSLYKLPEINLLDEQSWSYVQRRYRMSSREVQVARLVCHGFSNKEIAEGLKIELGTVKVHLRNIYRRVHVRNKVVLLLTFINDVNKLFCQSPNAGIIPVMTNRSESISKTPGL